MNEFTFAVDKNDRRVVVELGTEQIVVVDTNVGVDGLSEASAVAIHESAVTTYKVGI